MSTITQPALFVSHGAPTLALEDSPTARFLDRLGQTLPRPTAVVVVSAHWESALPTMATHPTPGTIHDFGGFPRELYQVQYPAPGDPDLARRVAKLLAPLDVNLDETWGLDHGTWSVLRHAYPAADIPVVQLSIDQRAPASFHFDLGRRLAPLRAEGVLIAASGNLVHNLRAYDWGGEAHGPYDWAARFERRARALIEAGEFQPLVEYGNLGADAALAIPTPDHYLPLLYVLGARQPADPIAFPVEGVDGGSVSMLAVCVGA